MAFQSVDRLLNVVCLIIARAYHMLAAGPYWMHIPQRMDSIFIWKKGIYNPMIVAVTLYPRF